MPEDLRISDVRRELLVDAVELLKNSRSEYHADPRKFFEDRDIAFFPVFERMFDDLLNTRVKKAVALGPRGGGKTFGAAVVATAFFLFKDFDVGIVAGSETQALTLFGYITEWLDLIEEEEQFGDAVERVRHSDLVGVNGNRIVAKTASARSIRGMHLGRGKRGALLIIDEEAETDEDVMRSARYTVRTARPAIILRMSTYHKLIGSFARLVENHKEQGYEMYNWDSFDIAEPCPYECEQCPEPVFREKYCRGKAKNSRGWVKIDEIVGEWRDTNRETFEVEVMGMRPAAAGLIILPGDLDKAIDLGDRGMPSEFDYSWACIDWGFAGMTAVVILGMKGKQVFVRHTEHFSRHGIDVIVNKLLELRAEMGIREVYADSSHPFENDTLRNEGFAVWGQKGSDTLGVPFVKFKEEGVAVLSYLFEKGLMGVPASHRMLIRQFRSWRRDDSGHIVKKDDHFPDALIAGMQKVKQCGIGIRGRKGRFYGVSHRVFSRISRVGRAIRRAFLG